MSCCVEVDGLQPFALSSPLSKHQGDTPLSPANYIISIFGGVRATARALKRSPSTVSKWRKSRKEGGTGGQIPTMIQPKVLKIAAERKLPITPNDLIYGRIVKPKERKSRGG